MGLLHVISFFRIFNIFAYLNLNLYYLLNSKAFVSINLLT